MANCQLCGSNRLTMYMKLCYSCFNTVPTKLPEPTDAIPGSEEKIKVLKQRAENNQLLWHPGDLFLNSR